MFELMSHYFIADTRKVYGTVVEREDHLYREDGLPFSVDDYVSNPEKYRSAFAEKVISSTIDYGR